MSTAVIINIVCIAVISTNAIFVLSRWAPSLPKPWPQAGVASVARESRLAGIVDQPLAGIFILAQMRLCAVSAALPTLLNAAYTLAPASRSARWM